MVRCILLFALSGGVIKLMGGEYQKAVQSFANQTAVICSEDSLMNYLKRIKQGSGYVVFEDDWTAGEICYFEIEKDGFCPQTFIVKRKTRSVSCRNLVKNARDLRCCITKVRCT